jgi:hypothetical protein
MSIKNKRRKTIFSNIHQVKMWEKIQQNIMKMNNLIGVIPLKKTHKLDSKSPLKLDRMLQVLK